LALKEFAIRGIVMSDSKVELYESLVRLSLIAVFMFALVVGTVGVVSICQRLMKSEMPRLEFVTRDLR
jgi:hypothetical protein